MKRGLFIIAAFLMEVPSPAWAQGVAMYWNDCSEGFGVTNRNFACSSNTGSSVLVVSFQPPSGITKLVGGSAVITLQSAAPQIPAWWQFGSGACREGALQLDFNPTVNQACADYWSAGATGSFSYGPDPYGNRDRARITVSWGIPEAMAGPVELGVEYYAFKLTLDHSKTVGSGACSGCIDPACMWLNGMWLYQPAGEGAGDQLLCQPMIGRDHYVAWQGGVIGGAGCPPVHELPPPWEPCVVTPAIRRTWGLIKGLYR